MNLTEDQAKAYLAEFRKLAAVASNSANAAMRAERNIDALAKSAANEAMSEKFGAMSVVAGAEGSDAEWDAVGNTLTIPSGPAGQDGTSITGIQLTQAAYDALTAGEKADLTKLYIIKD